MFYRNMKMLKCKNEYLMTSHFCTLLWLLENLGICDRVHVSNQLILVHALAHTPVPNCMSYSLYCDHFDQWFITKKA